jgi:Xaa-Pro aminopeptidase
MAQQVRDPERDSMVRGALRAAGLKAILAWYPEDTVMLGCGWSSLGLAAVLYPVDAEPVCYAGACEPDDVLPAGFLHRRFAVEPGSWGSLRALIAADLARLAVGAGDLGVAGDSAQHAVTSFPGETPLLAGQALRDVAGGAAAREAGAVFAGLARRKTRREVEALRVVNAAAAAGIEAFHGALVPGATEAEVAARVESAIHCFTGKQGCRLARGWAHVQGGESIYLAGTYSRSSSLRLAEGDLVLLELGTCVDGYWSDLTRTAGVGKIGERQGALLSAVKAAQKAAIAAVRPGAAHAAVDAAARASLTKAGYGEGFVHGTGHHVGFSYHDRGPGLAAGNTQPLEQGMVITVEPGTYGRGFGGGARFEDNVVVTAGGAEVISPMHLSWNGDT